MLALQIGYVDVGGFMMRTVLRFWWSFHVGDPFKNQSPTRFVSNIRQQYRIVVAVNFTIGQLSLSLLLVNALHSFDLVIFLEIYSLENHKIYSKGRFWEFREVLFSPAVDNLGWMSVFGFWV